MATFFDRFKILYKEFRRSDYKDNGRIAFAKKLGVSRGQISGWLDGTGSPDFETLKNISKKLKVSTLWLIGEIDEREPKLMQSETSKMKVEKDIEVLLDFLSFKHGNLAENVLKERLKEK